MPVARPSIFSALTTSVLLCACGGDTQAPLVAADIEITTPAAGAQMSAGYLRLINNTDSAISITRVVSPDFESIEIHESLLEDGVAKMRRVHELAIPANSTVSLERGGKHLMLMRPTAPTEQVSLSFYGDGTLLLGIKVPLTRRDN